VVVACQVTLHQPPVRVRLFLYAGVPLLCIGALIACYYSDVAALRRVVSPDTESIPESLRREFGLLESLQNLVLATICVLAGIGLRKKRLPAERIGLWVMLIGTALMLLEETDYFTQYALLFGADVPAGPPRNLHRIGYSETLLRNVAYLGSATFFGAFALLFAKSSRPVMRYVAPDRLSVVTVLLVTALQEIVWWKSARVALHHGSLTGNEIEFFELGIYYLVMLWMIDMVFWRRCEPKPENG